MSLTITSIKQPPGGVVARKTTVPFRSKPEDFQQIPKVGKQLMHGIYEETSTTENCEHIIITKQIHYILIKTSWNKVSRL